MEEYTIDSSKRESEVSQYMLDDLQLAAELGKTLLERNKELEILLKEHKTSNEEKEREILHLRKQIDAMSEVNDSRLKVYEQLEVGIQDLERSNHRLNLDKTRDKKQIKSLTSTIEALEARCEELNKQVEEARQDVVIERRKNEKLKQERSPIISNAESVRGIKSPNEKHTPNNNDSDIMGTGTDENQMAQNNISFIFEQRNKANSTGLNESILQCDHSVVGNLSNCIIGTNEDNEDLIKLVSDLETTKRSFLAEQQRCSELEEQLVVIIQENQVLQSRLAQTSANEEVMSMYDELSLLDCVRQGQMCSRCLRAVDALGTINDEQSSAAPTDYVEEEDEASLLDVESQRDVDQASDFSSQASFRPSGSMKLGARPNNPLHLNLRAGPNPYRDLVEKYEALLKVQRSSIAFINKSEENEENVGSNSLSLADEFKSEADIIPEEKPPSVILNSQSTNDANTAGAIGQRKLPSLSTKNLRDGTPTEFSETETSSSGFLDETSNKYTQTDERPGYFLCSIGDGEDCKFSIYDDVSPIDSHFRNRPEYRELFKEIFGVLKKAAENKEESDRVSLLDDEPQNEPTCSKVPPVTPANEEFSISFANDTESIISSVISEQSIAMSECITKLERKTAKKHIIESKNQETTPPLSQGINILPVESSANPKNLVENGRVLTPFKRETLEYLTIGVGIKKKNRRKNRSFQSNGAESPLAMPSPQRSIGGNSGRRARRDFVPISTNAILATEQDKVGGRRGRRKSTDVEGEWNGSPMVIYNRNLSATRPLHPREVKLNGHDYRPNTVSQEFHKLKKLDLSYAEVLRRSDACEHQHQQQQNQQRQRRRNDNHMKSHRHHY